MDSRMQIMVFQCNIARDAPHAVLAFLQVEVRDVFQRLMGELCDGVNPSATSARILKGGDGAFIEACLQAQSIAWPDPTCRLSIAENSVGILDNCTEYDGILAVGGLLRVLKGLLDLEDSLLTASPALSSGVLESYGLYVSRLMGKTRNSWGSESASAIVTLLNILKRTDLQCDGRREAVELLCALVRAAPEDYHFPDLEVVLFEEMKINLPSANPYLRMHEALAKLQKEPGVFGAFETVRSHRRRIEKLQQSNQ